MVVQWSGRRTCDQQVVSPTSVRCPVSTWIGESVTVYAGKLSRCVTVT